MTALLFVYGTLRAGVRNSRAELLGDGAALLGEARVRGALYDLGNYPGLVPSEEPGAWVRGELFTLDDPARTLARLDEYEGCDAESPRPHAFERVRLRVWLDGGEALQAWSYAWRGATDPSQRIRTGDYRIG